MKNNGTHPYPEVSAYTMQDLKDNLANTEACLSREYVNYRKEKARREKLYTALRLKRTVYLAAVQGELQRRKELAKVKARCRRLAKKIGAEVEVGPESEAIWVYAPESLEAGADPYRGQHFTEGLGLAGWHEAETRLREYAALIETAGEGGA
jgi:16S rRNA C967 or C1407 C5-methylase (RsmB/RsmF family)